MSGASIDELRRTLADGPPTAELHARLGTALLRSGAAQEAERELRTAIDLDPKCARAWVNLGGILFARWEFGAAVEANRRAAAAEPALAIAHFNQAMGQLQLGATEQAVECLERVVALEPGNAVAHHYLGVALHALGRALEAKLCLAYAEELGHHPSRAAIEALERAAAPPEGGNALARTQSDCSP
jgi:Flp pilus assembly protein TadD